MPSALRVQSHIIRRDNQDPALSARLSYDLVLMNAPLIYAPVNAFPKASFQTLASSFAGQPALFGLFSCLHSPLRRDPKCASHRHAANMRYISVESAPMDGILANPTFALFLQHLHPRCIPLLTYALSPCHLRHLCWLFLSMLMAR